MILAMGLQRSTGLLEKLLVRLALHSRDVQCHQGQHHCEIERRIACDRQSRSHSQTLPMRPFPSCQLLPSFTSVRSLNELRAYQRNLGFGERKETVGASFQLDQFGPQSSPGDWIMPRNSQLQHCRHGYRECAGVVTRLISVFHKRWF